MADIFTKAKEQGREKKIAFENAAGNLKKDMQHLLLKVLFMKENRKKARSLCSVFLCFFL